MEKIIVYTHSDCLAKDNGPNHPERKERLETVIESVKELENLDIEFKEAPLAEPETISLVHPYSHLNNIFSMIPSSGLKYIPEYYKNYNSSDNIHIASHNYSY